MTNALIVYGTRYGATELTAKEIADVFRQEGLDVKVANLKDEKIKVLDQLLVQCRGYCMLFLSENIYRPSHSFPASLKKDMLLARLPFQ